MRNTAVLLAWGLLCGTALLLATSTGAQVIDEQACVDACERERAACIESCNDHANPMDCDGECHETLQECMRGCR